MNTKKEIIDKIYHLIGEDQTSTVFDKEGEVAPKVNDVIDKICRCEVKNILTDTKIRGGILDFLYEEKTVKIPRAKQLMVDIDENSRTITLDNVDDLPTSGYLEIEGNIISYGGIDDDGVLIKVAGINGYHPMKSEVHFAYIMPSKVLKPADIYDNSTQTILRFVDFREYKGYGKCYTLKPNNGRKFAIFYNIENPVTISYSKRLEEMEADTDECGLPDKYGERIVAYLVAGGELIDTSEGEKGKQLLQIGYAELEDMYSFYATPNKRFRKKIRVRSMTPGYMGDRDDLVPLRSN